MHTLESERSDCLCNSSLRLLPLSHQSITKRNDAGDHQVSCDSHTSHHKLLETGGRPRAQAGQPPSIAGKDTWLLT